MLKTVTPDKYARDPDTWITYGEILYRAARALFELGTSDPSLLIPAATLAHAAVEVVMKGVLIGEGMVSFRPDDVKRLPSGVVIKKEDCIWGHSLLELAGELERRTAFDLSEEMEFHNVRFPKPFSVRQALEFFEPFFDELRYPSGLKNVTSFGSGDELVLEELIARILALREPEDNSTARSSPCN